MTINPTNDLITLASPNGVIVTLKQDGNVVWTPHIDVDAAAEAFGNSIKLGAEYSVGFDKTARANYVRAIYNALIDLAEEKGVLTVEDLTDDLQQYILITKLKES